MDGQAELPRDRSVEMMSVWELHCSPAKTQSPTPYYLQQNTATLRNINNAFKKHTTFLAAHAPKNRGGKKKLPKFSVISDNLITYIYKTYQDIENRKTALSSTISTHVQWHDNGELRYTNKQVQDLRVWSDPKWTPRAQRRLIRNGAWQSR